jgi:hypothetical protein
MLTVTYIWPSNMAGILGFCSRILCRMGNNPHVGVRVFKTPTSDSSLQHESRHTQLVVPSATKLYKYVRTSQASRKARPSIRFSIHLDQRPLSLLLLSFLNHCVSQTLSFLCYNSSDAPPDPSSNSCSCTAPQLCLRTGHIYSSQFPRPSRNRRLPQRHLPGKRKPGR